MVAEKRGARTERGGLFEGGDEDLLGDQYQTPADVFGQEDPTGSVYKLARKGQTVERRAARDPDHRFELTGFELPLVRFVGRPAAGGLRPDDAHDLGQKLGCGRATSANSAARGVLGISYSKKKALRGTSCGAFSHTVCAGSFLPVRQARGPSHVL